MSQDEVAITDVDCTPRRRWRESQDAFERRMRDQEARRDLVDRHARFMNRHAAVCDTIDGVPLYSAGGVRLCFAKCACGWHGLQVADPEVARREYDAHVCAIGVDEVHPAMRQYRGPVDRRPESALVPALSVEGIAEVPPVEIATDDAEQRMALLELK